MTDLKEAVHLARLLSVNVGHPREIAWRGKTVYTSVWKQPVEGRRLVRRLNVNGDAQGDLNGHGGEQQRRFFCLPGLDTYHYWERELRRNGTASLGRFGENFTVEGLAEQQGVRRRPLSDRRGGLRDHPTAR